MEFYDIRRVAYSTYHSRRIYLCFGCCWSLLLIIIMFIVSKTNVFKYILQCCWINMSIERWQTIASCDRHVGINHSNIRFHNARTNQNGASASSKLSILLALPDVINNICVCLRRQCCRWWWADAISSLVRTTRGRSLQPVPPPCTLSLIIMFMCINPCSVKVWDATTTSMLRPIDTLWHTGGKVEALVAAGDYICSAGTDSRIRVWGPPKKTASSDTNQKSSKN